jgi:hypothetical protein
MLTNEQRVALWGDGPWIQERDFLGFRTRVGYQGEIFRNPQLGTLCGYVFVPEGHPAYGLGENGLEDIEIHGGVTYSSFAGDVKRLWRIGFDCGHVRDYIPGISNTTQKKFFGNHYGALGASVYRDWDYVVKEVESLARQLMKMEKRK